MNQGKTVEREWSVKGNGMSFMQGTAVTQTHITIPNEQRVTMNGPQDGKY